MNLLFISLAPVVIIAIYIYIRDKYEHEPIGALISALLTGAIVTIPIIFTEKYLSTLNPFYSLKEGNAFYTAFVVAGFTEETFKLAGLLLLIWYNRNFNEKFDGIVYAVFISLGFATAENIMYVFSYGYNVGIVRALTAVPAHALFGVAMGYYFAIAKFYPSKRSLYIFYSFFIPVILHGLYDYLLMSEMKIMTIIFIPFIILLWIYGLKNMKKLSEQSVYRNDGIGKQNSNFFGL